MERPNDGAILQTTDASLGIFARIKDRGGATLGQLVAETRRAKSSVYAHLQTLRANDLVTKEGETYHVGLRTLGYAEQARTRKPEYDLARAAVDDLVERVGDESGFAVEENGRAILLYNAANVGGATFRIGEDGPMHATASGQAMLAAYPDDRVAEILDYRGLSSPSERAITDRDALFDELEAIRSRGYSVVDQEFVEGMRSVGTAVRYPDGRVFGALHVSAPAYRESKDQFRDAVADVLLSAGEALESEIARATQ
ncbi:IclR family transcriptional regulator [Halobacteriales archaeon QS_1_68_17]|nr:MAG: IclR family transcriptional regulator [Halobacteriales archaeon QS_1_68_17]